MSISDYIEDRARAKQREIKYEIWKAKNHDSRMRTQGALLGALVGVTAGILLAPKSGEETRKDIGDAFDETVRTVKETTTDAIDSAKDTYEDLKYRAYTDLEPVREGFEYGAEIAKETGAKVVETAGNVGQAVSTGAKEVGEIVSDTASGVAHEVKEGAEKAGQVASVKGEEVKEETKKAGEEVKFAADLSVENAKETVEETKKADDKAKKENKNK